MLRLERTADQLVEIAGHAPGTLHHIYLVTGKLRTGPVSDTVDLAAGDFVRFPGDVAHRLVCLSDRAVLHMVTTLPQVRQFGPTVTRSGGNGNGAAITNTEQ
jgi:quercetin dioxygenase-like cupin family protein